MKNLLFLCLGLSLLTMVACGEGGMSGDDDNLLATEMDSMCYAVGASFSMSMQGTPIELNGSQITKGYMDCKNGDSYVNEGNSLDYTNRIQNEFSGVGSIAAPDSGQEKMDIDSLSYIMGSAYFLQLKNLDMGLNDAALTKGIEDNLAGGTSLLDETQVQALMRRFGEIAQQAQQAKEAKDMVVNKEAGQAFLAEKAQEEGVKATGSGLLYEVIEEGSGKSPVPTDRVSVHYEGRLIDGTIFDSSIKRGQPTEFPLNGVIKGWTEGLQLMKPGAKYRFYIPSDLAYGDQAAGATIGAGSTLIFDVELLEIK